MLTVLYDIVHSIRLTNWLEVMALIVVIFLFSSPGIAGTILGIGTKIGIYKHATAEDPAEE